MVTILLKSLREGLLIEVAVQNCKIQEQNLGN